MTEDESVLQGIGESLNNLENALQQLIVETFEIEEVADTNQHAAGSTCSSTCSSCCGGKN